MSSHVMPAGGTVSSALEMTTALQATAYEFKLRRVDRPALFGEYKRAIREYREGKIASACVKLRMVRAEVRRRIADV